MSTQNHVEILKSLTASSLHNLKTHINHLRTALGSLDVMTDSAIHADGLRVVEIGQLEAAYGNLMPSFRNVQTNQVRLAEAINAKQQSALTEARIESLENAVNLVLALHRTGALHLDAKAKQQLQLAVL